jgi:hypothetical protein
MGVCGRKPWGRRFRSLVAQNGDELAKAFEAFNAWSRMTDPDSVEITFVFRNSGGYVLAISPEYLRLERRCLGFDRTHQAVAFAPTWFKPIDSVHPLLLQFRRHCSAPIAPFLFTGATYFGPRGVLTPASAPDIRPIPNLEPLLRWNSSTKTRWQQSHRMAGVEGRGDTQNEVAETVSRTTDAKAGGRC